MSRTQATKSRNVFNHFEHRSDDRVVVDSRCLPGTYVGTVENLRKKPCSRQYLVNLDDAGRTWFDEHEVDPVGGD